MMEMRSDVPCGSCTLCCRRDIILLFPEHGDVVDSYDHVTIPTPSGDAHMISKGADGNCIYLGASGCTIHDRAPNICRVFDCRDLFTSKSREERRRMIKAGICSKEIFAAGRSRL